MIQTIKNEKGSSYIFSSFMVLIMAGLFSVLLLFLSFVGQFFNTRRTIQRTMDDYLSVLSIEVYEELQNGADFAERLDGPSVCRSLIEKTGFGLNGDRQISSSFGLGEIVLSNPEAQYDSSPGLGLTLTYDVQIRFVFMGDNYLTPAARQRNVAIYTLKTRD